MATALQDILDTIEDIAINLHALVAFQEKVTPSKILSDQYEELAEVLDFQRERLHANEGVFTVQAQLPLSSLLREFKSISRWFSENDPNLKGFWPAQQTSDSVELIREKSLKVFATRLSLAIFLSQEDAGQTEEAVVSLLDGNPEDFDSAKLGRMASLSSPPALMKASRLLKNENGELEDGIADFSTSGGGLAMKEMFDTFESTARTKALDDARARSLAQLVAQDFDLHDASAVSLRPASPSTVDSPLDPHHNDTSTDIAAAQQRQSTSNRVHDDDAASELGTPTEDMYTNFRPSFVPSSAFELEHELETRTSSPRGVVSTESTAAVTESGPALHITTQDSANRSSRTPSSRSGSTSASNGTNGNTVDPNLGERLGLTSSIIAFNARDALTNKPLIDPVLGSDGLIHDRWSLIDAENEVARTISILGDVVQLREAIHSAQDAKKAEFAQKRAAYRNRAIDLCTSSEPKQMLECISRLTNILQWKPDDVDILTRRGVLYYRLRMLTEAKADLDLAVKTSQATSLINLPHLDSLRYRCLVLSEIRDVENALTDMDEIEKQTKDDPLILSLRATIRASKGDASLAAKDLDSVKKALETGGGSQSRLADENKDLDLLAKGWAHSSIGQIEEAVKDFEMAQSLRVFDAYSVSCLGISLVHYGLMLSGQGDEIKGNEKTRQGLGELTSAVVVVSRNSSGDELTLPSPNGTIDDALVDMTMTPHAYDPFFLRGMANFALGDYQKALDDFDVAQRVRPKIVKDTGEFHCVLGILQAETGQYDKATRSFDYAMALKPEEREQYHAKRTQYGL